MITQNFRYARLTLENCCLRYVLSLTSIRYWKMKYSHRSQRNVIRLTKIESSKILINLRLAGFLNTKKQLNGKIGLNGFAVLITSLSRLNFQKKILIYMKIISMTQILKRRDSMETLIQKSSRRLNLNSKWVSSEAMLIDNFAALWKIASTQRHSAQISVSWSTTSGTKLNLGSSLSTYHMWLIQYSSRIGAFIYWHRRDKKKIGKTHTGSILESCSLSF